MAPDSKFWKKTTDNLVPIIFLNEQVKRPYLGMIGNALWWIGW